MKNLIYLFLVTSFFLASCSKDCPTPQSQETYLFVHTADSAQILNDTTIVMPVTNGIFAFTDRPYRVSTYLNGETFTGLWSDTLSSGFYYDPPNAVLTWADDEGINEVEVVLIAAFSDSNTITYTVNDALVIPTGNITDVSLFIDDLAVNTGFNCMLFCLPPPDPHSHCYGC
jgi:hypothetical protein